MVKSRLVIRTLFGFLLFLWMCNIVMEIQLVDFTGAEDIASYFHMSTSLNLSISNEQGSDWPDIPTTESELRINWYDLQTDTEVSMLNTNIDVKKEYRFCVNISSDHGWESIDFINITAWFDFGSESTTYNTSGYLGGNLNMFLQYGNTTGTAYYKKVWPDNEVTIGGFTEIVVSDPNGISGSTECHNLSFSFVPGYQFRYAPGEGIWNKKTNTFNDLWSWNFKITATSLRENASMPDTVWVIDEFGVNSYREIVSAGLPYIQGAPGETVSADRKITVISRSNTNYALSVDVKSFIHETHPTGSFSNQTLWVGNGNLIGLIKFTGKGPIYLYGSSKTFVDADDDNVSRVTNDIYFKCTIPFAQLPGEYSATLYYKLYTQTNTM